MAKTAKVKKPGTVERARRRAAVATAGETGFTTGLKRGFAMIGALVREATVPTKKVPSRAQIRKLHTQKVATKKAASAKKTEAAMKRSEPARRKVEGATGTSRITNPLRAIQALTKKARKRD